MRVLLIITAFLLVFQANAENKNKKALGSYSISGKVVGGGENLTGVKVVLDDKETIVYTDFDGNFTIENLRGDKHILSLSYVAYNNKEVLITPNASNELVISLYGK